jgi:hypothetical protein
MAVFREWWQFRPRNVRPASLQFSGQCGSRLKTLGTCDDQRPVPVISSSNAKGLRRPQYDCDPFSHKKAALFISTAPLYFSGLTLIG